MDNQPYIFELTGHDHWPTLNPLHAVIVPELLTSDRVCAIRRIEPAPNASSVVRACARYRRAVYDHSYWRILFRRLFNWVLPLPTKTRVTRQAICSTIVAQVLADAGVLNVSPCDVFPQDFATQLLLHPPYRWEPLQFLRLRQ